MPIISIWEKKRDENIKEFQFIPTQTPTLENHNPFRPRNAPHSAALHSFVLHFETLSVPLYEDFLEEWS